MSSFGISQDVYVVNDIYTIEDDSSYSLIIDHDYQSSIEYTVRENFDPPTLIIQITNARWERGDFTRKSAHSPLYQFDVNSLNNKKSKQKADGIRVRMSFNIIPEYSVIESSLDDRNSLIIKFRLAENVIRPLVEITATPALFGDLRISSDIALPSRLSYCPQLQVAASQIGSLFPVCIDVRSPLEEESKPS